MSKSIEINDVGPIRSVSIPVPQGGGVVVLRGGNGSGKSTALDAVDAMARGSGSLQARARRGSKRGEVAGLGAKINVGLRRAVRTGDLEVASFDSRASVAELVDPGVKDPEAADRRRMAVACTLAGIRPDSSLFEKVLGDLPEVPNSDDLVTYAESLRAAYQSAAREQERVGDRESGVCASLREAAMIPVSYTSSEDTDAALEAAVKALAQVESRQAEWERNEERRVEARKVLDRIGEGHTSPVEAKRALEEKQVEQEIARTKVAGLEAALEEARETYRGLTYEVESLTQKVDHAATIQAAVDEANAVLEHDAESKPSPQEKEAAEEAVKTARYRAKIKAEGDKAVAKGEELAAARRRLEEAMTAAEANREAAIRVWDVVADHLAAVMPRGLRVVNSRLVVESGSKQVEFAELSDGERWRIALDLAIEAMGGAGLIAIEQPAWEGLDGNARSHIAQHAEDRGVVIVTAEADHGRVVGGLRAELFGSAKEAMGDE